LIPRSEQFSLRFTNADLHSFALFAPILGAVFAAVGFLLIALSLRRLVQSQRRELGTLLAMGYRRTAVLATVLLPAAVLAVPGAAVAVSVTIGIGRLVSGTYVSAVGFPTIVSTLAAGPLAQAAGVAIGATIAAAALPAWTLLRLTPAAAMRGEPAVRFQPPGWLGRATGTTSPQVAYAGRSLARRPLLTAATVLSLSAAVGLGAALNLLIGSTNRAVDETFAGQGWTAAVGLANPATAADHRRRTSRCRADPGERADRRRARRRSRPARARRHRERGTGHGRLRDRSHARLGAERPARRPGRRAAGPARPKQRAVRCGERHRCPKSPRPARGRPRHLAGHRPQRDA